MQKERAARLIIFLPNKNYTYSNLFISFFYVADIINAGRRVSRLGLNLSTRGRVLARLPQKRLRVKAKGGKRDVSQISLNFGQQSRAFFSFNYSLKRGMKVIAA